MEIRLLQHSEAGEYEWSWPSHTVEKFKHASFLALCCPMRLSCLTIIIMQNAAEDIVSLNEADVWNRFYWDGTLLLESLMRSSRIVVSDVAFQRVT